MAIARLSVKVGGSGKAEPHAAYIAREGKYKNRLEKSEKLEVTGTGNMPAWAAHDAQVFWQAADTYERKNGSTYREHEIALPRELDPGQRLELVNDWIKNELGENHAYQFAIHTPTAADGGEQPHVHLMFCERKNDGIARDPDQYFKRYNRKHPERGGAQKTNFSMKANERREALKAQRKRWQDLCNDHLKRAGLDEQIDMRSYADQGIDQTPEPKMLPSEWRDPEQKNNVIALRAALSVQQQAQAEVSQLIPDRQAQLRQEQALQPESLEKRFSQELKATRNERDKTLKGLQQDAANWEKRREEHIQTYPLKKGIFGIFTHRKKLEIWQDEFRRIDDKQQSIAGEIRHVNRVSVQEQAEENFMRKHPVLATERERQDALARLAVRQKEPEKERLQQLERERLETLAREKQLEQERLERDRLAKEHKERAAREQTREEERTRPARLRRENREAKQRFFADVLRRQNKKEMAKYPVLTKIQRDIELSARTTNRTMDDLVETTARHIEKGFYSDLERKRGLEL